MNTFTFMGEVIPYSKEQNVPLLKKSNDNGEFATFRVKEEDEETNSPIWLCKINGYFLKKYEISIGTRLQISGRLKPYLNKETKRSSYIIDVKDINIFGIKETVHEDNNKPVINKNIEELFVTELTFK